MVNKLATKTGSIFEWVDLADPSKEEIERVAEEYNLHESSIKDYLQLDHLPKFEKLDNYTFIILRIHALDVHEECDTVSELTDKVAIFASKDTLITIRHNNEFELQQTGKSTFQALNEIIRAGLLTYEEPAAHLTRSIEHLEENVFLRQRKIALLKKLYFIKRKIDVIRRILILTHDIIDHIDSPQSGTAYTRDTRDLYIRMTNIFDSLSDNTNQLLNIYFSISAQKTNEIIRVLTLFSVFFMPLTFIVGIYGMNFDFMPELRWKLGYPGVLVGMAVLTIIIYVWFRKKGWL